MEITWLRDALLKSPHHPPKNILQVGFVPEVVDFLLAADVSLCVVSIDILPPVLRGSPMIEDEEHASARQSEMSKAGKQMLEKKYPNRKHQLICGDDYVNLVNLIDVLVPEIDNYDIILIHCVDEDEETAKDAFFYSLQYAHPATMVALENETFTELWQMLRDGGVVSPLEAEQQTQTQSQSPSCGIISVHQLQRAQEYRKTKNLQVQRIE